MEMRAVFATSVTRYAATAAVGMNRQAMVFERSRSSFLIESIRNAAIRKLTPAQELAIRKPRSLLM
jgi:hypothetical protein